MGALPLVLYAILRVLCLTFNRGQSPGPVLQYKESVFLDNDPLAHPPKAEASLRYGRQFIYENAGCARGGPATSLVGGLQKFHLIDYQRR